MEKLYRRAALYALYPNELGLCGPRGSEKGKLYQYLTAPSEVSDNQARKLFEQFIAATAYFKLIAGANGINDWLDPRVIDAYWIGNNFLNHVRSEDLKSMILGFVGLGRMTKAAAEEAAGRIHPEHRPHHSFHVLTIGGISGQVERESIGWELCRIGWGKVQSVKGETLVMRARMLMRSGDKYLPRLGGEKLIEIKRDPQIVPHVKVGDIVTCHWGRAVEVIDEEAAKRLEDWTELTLRHCSVDI